MKRKICVVTGSRSEYGLLKSLMKLIEADTDLTLQIIVTGMHLSSKFGLSYREIESDGFVINKKVHTLEEGDTAHAIAIGIASGIAGCSEALVELEPHLVIVLGDRHEIFAAATAAFINRIPIAHIHGGETTEGLIDEAIRHSITKMAQLHFVAAEEYRKRVVQLGEDPERVHLVGAIGLDNIADLELLDKKQLEIELGIPFRARSLLVTFHPVTLENDTSELHINELLKSLSHLEDTTIIFTLPNLEVGSYIIMQKIQDFVSTHPNSYSFMNMGTLKYLSCVNQVDIVVGNSSSGLIEVPSFKKASVNIGDRQSGRLKSDSVIDCAPLELDITSAIKKAFNPDFQKQLIYTKNKYGESGASKKILKKIKESDLNFSLKKKFYDQESK